jgi:hypothetical protein
MALHLEVQWDRLSNDEGSTLVWHCSSSPWHVAPVFFVDLPKTLHTPGVNSHNVQQIGQGLPTSSRYAAVQQCSAHEDTDDEEPVASIVTADEFLELGFGIFFDVEQLRNVKKSANLDRFVAHYGCLPLVCACFG